MCYCRNKVAENNHGDNFPASAVEFLFGERQADDKRRANGNYESNRNDNDVRNYVFAEAAFSARVELIGVTC